MTKKHFKLLAIELERTQRNLNSGVDDASNRIRAAVWRECVMAVIRACEASNPAFKRQRFIDACGGLFNA